MAFSPRVSLLQQRGSRVAVNRVGKVNHHSSRLAPVVRVTGTDKDRKEPNFGERIGEKSGLGDALGPIGLTLGGEIKKESVKSPVELGPIGLTFNPDTKPSEGLNESVNIEAERPPSISRMTNEEWRKKFEKDGTVDLWVEEEFNAGSRLVGGRDAFYGKQYGLRTGEGPSAGDVPTHRIKILNRFANQEMEVDVPEDRYIMWEAEDHGLDLPYSCRMGCCTACAVRIVKGSMYQPEALGISEELKEQGFGLMCVGYPTEDAVLETVTEDEVYDLQFGQYFASQALNPDNLENVERDDFAIEVANMDE